MCSKRHLYRLLERGVPFTCQLWSQTHWEASLKEESLLSCYLAFYSLVEKKPLKTKKTPKNVKLYSITHISSIVWLLCPVTKIVRHKTRPQTIQGHTSDKRKTCRAQKQNLQHSQSVRKNIVTEAILDVYCTLKVRVMAKSLINPPTYPNNHPQRTYPQGLAQCWLNERKSKGPWHSP